MLKAKCLLCLGVVLLMGRPSLGAEKDLQGTYKLSYFLGHGNMEVNVLLIKLETKDGKVTGTLLSNNRRFPRARFSDIALDDSSLRIKLEDAPRDAEFEGKIGAKDILGVYTADKVVYPARLVKSDLDKIELKDAYVRFPLPPIDKIPEIRSRLTKLRVQAQREKDETKRAELQKKVAEAVKAADKEIADLYRETLAEYPDSPPVFLAGYMLLTDATNKPTVQEARGWAQALMKAAQAYGPKLESETAFELANLLIKKENLEELALEYARKAEKVLTERTAAERQSDILRLLAKALRKNHKTDELKDVDARIVTVEGVLDREYLSKMPPFKTAQFPGRKGTSDRAAVLELFTDAHSLPCVAASVAFDALEKTYKPAELILLQYHLHSAPLRALDPLASADTDARFTYYRERFPRDVRGTPMTLFNGIPKAASGGDLSPAQVKYNEYRAVIDPLLEESTPVHLTAMANPRGNRIDIKAEVNNLTEPGENKRLRFVLVEESVHYVGMNKLRFHHHVVRALPGGIQGLALKEKNSQHAVTVDLDELRQQLVKHLDEDARTQKIELSSQDTPLNFKDLKVVALVQDDANRAILQAVQVGVSGEPGVR